MSKIKIYGFFAVVAFQALSLTGMIGAKYAVTLTGTEVVLDSAPVDPRDLLRGDFVRLNLSISHLDLGRLDGPDSFREKDEIFVVLVKGEPAWTPARVSAELPEVVGDEAVIKGRVSSVSGGRVTVDYGLDSYFVPENTGRAVERVRYWRVKLDRRGRSVLEGPVAR